MAAKKAGKKTGRKVSGIKKTGRKRTGSTRSRRASEVKDASISPRDRAPHFNEVTPPPVDFNDQREAPRDFNN